MADNPTPTPVTEAFSFSVKDALSTARDAALLVAVILFVAGYSFREGYFRTLAVPSHALTIDINETMLYAITVLFENNNAYFFGLYLIGISIVAFAIRIVPYDGLSNKRRAQGIGGVVTLAVATFMWFSIQVSWRAGMSEADKMFDAKAGELAIFSFDDKLPRDERVFLEKYDSDATLNHLVLVAETADSYFIVVTTPDSGHHLPVHRIPKSLVQSIKTIPNDSMTVPKDSK